MAKNAIQFQAGMSLPKFIEAYGRQPQCRAALMAWRWPQGFQCPRCSYRNACRVREGTVYQCHRCHQQTSLTAGTLFAGDRHPCPPGRSFVYQAEHLSTKLRRRA